VIVSIARELGAGGLSVGEAIAGALQCPLLDERAFIEILSHRHGIDPAALAERIERPPSAGEQLISDLASATAMLPIPAAQTHSAEFVIDTVRETVIEHARGGHVVVIGHGGVSLLGWRPEGIPVLAILLRAGRAWRIEQLARRYAITGEDARTRVDRTDEARARFQRHYFASDIYDSRQYDLVLNTESLGLETASTTAVKIAAALAKAEAQPAPS
jgi:cytidylate kinase